MGTRRVSRLKYSSAYTLVYLFFKLLDCLIQLLHSSVIDVDRLDYIIRDASTMGYQSVSIDYERLLSGIVAVRDGEYNFTVDILRRTRWYICFS